MHNSGDSHVLAFFVVGTQIGDNQRDYVSRGGLRGGVAICLQTNRHQTEDGNQAKSGDPQSESHLDKGKCVWAMGEQFHFL